MANETVCPRLLDYLAIVGLRNPNRIGQKNNVVPELLRRYPHTDHKNGPLPQDVVYFCQPDGCTNSCSSRNDAKDSNNFVFTLTDKETGKVRYGICMNFLRPIERRSPVKVARTSQERLGSVSSVEMSTAHSTKESLHKPNKRIRPKTHSLTSLLIISHHPCFKGFQVCLSILREIIEKFEERTKRRSNGRDSIWPTLLGSISENINSVIHHDVMEIETWIFRLLSSPVPVAGITRIELSLLPESIMKPVKFALPDDDRFPLADFSIHTIFELMGVEFALKLFVAVLLENKVILQSKNYNVLSTSILAIKSLFYPLEYMFPISTLLPTHMPSAEQLFTAPSPFIFGIPSSFLSVRKSFKMPSDVWFFDLDLRQLLKCNNSKMVPQSNIDNDLSLPPTFELNILIKHIKQAIQVRQALYSISDKSEPVKNLDEILDNVELQPSKLSQLELAGFNPLIFGNDSDSVDVSTRVAMVRFFNSPSILGNYAKYTRILKLYPRPIVAFQVESFIKSRRIQSDFIKKLSRTQAVQFFCESNIAPKNTVFIQISSEKYDPRLIGDKSKWFDQNLEPINFKVYRENGSCTLHLLFNQDSKVESDSPTDESGSDSDHISDSSSSNRELTETCSDFADSGISECQRLTVDPSKIYYPPTYLQIPSINMIDNEKDRVSSIKSDSSSRQFPASDSEEIHIKKKERENIRQLDQQIKKSTKDKSLDKDLKSIKYDTDVETYPAEKKEQIKKTSNNETDTTLNPIMYSDFWNETSKKISGFLGNSISSPRPSLSPELSKINPSLKRFNEKRSLIDRDDLTNKLKEAHIDSRRSSMSSFFSDGKPNEQDNQIFIQQIISEILKGSTPNFILKYKIKNLLESESNRNIILSQLNKNLEKSDKWKEVFISDSVIESEDHFNALMWICKALVTGIESSYTKGICEGLGSVFVFLEMIHTHYVNKKSTGSSISMTSVNASPVTSNGRVHDYDSASSVNLVASIGMPFHINGDDFETIEMSTKNDQKPTQLFSGSNSDIDETQSMFSSHLSRTYNDSVRSKRFPVPNSLNIKSTASSVISLREDDFMTDYSLPVKSSASLGYRYKLNQLYYVKVPKLPDDINVQNKTKTSPKDGSFFSRFLGSPTKNYDSRSAPVNGNKSLDSDPHVTEPITTSHFYLFQKLITKSERSKLWDNMSFWEDVFYDAVCQEREFIGLDQDSKDLMDRYSSLDMNEKQRLEKNEDRLLGIVMNNLIAFMVMMEVDPMKIKSKARCMIGKSHIALDESANINKLIDSIKYLKGNDIDLLTNLSRQQDVKSFHVYCGRSKSGDLFEAEIHSDCMLLRTVSGTVVTRWWLERLIKCSSKKNVICIIRRENNEIVSSQLYCKRSKELIQTIQKNSEKFRILTGENMNSENDCGEVGVPSIQSTVENDPGISQFKVTDDVTKCTGTLKIDKDGLTFSSDDTEWFVDFVTVRRCFTKKPDRFIVEILDPNTKNLTYRIFKSFSFDQIAYCVLSKFSLLSAARQRHSQSHLSPISKP